MTKARLDAVIVSLTLGGGLVAFLTVAALLYRKVDNGSLAALVGLATLFLQQSAGIIRNRFPGPEIDVLPPGATQGDACTCGGGKQEEPT